MTAEEWESVCDGCGRCCLNKLTDVDTNETVYTDVGCKLLDGETCRCTDYPRRQAKVRDCVRLTPRNVKRLTWLPPTCGYRLIADGLADPQRLGIAGWSYGGMTTNYTIASTDRFAAAVSGAGISNQITGYGTDLYVRQYELEFGKPWEGLDGYLAASYPFFHADRIHTPTLFLCGEKDFNVPLVNSEQMYQVFSALKRHGLYFVDSRTTDESVCRPSARLFQIPFSQRDVFLDHAHDPVSIRKQIRELVRIAQRKGEAVGIAHPHPATYNVLKEELPALRQQVELVPASRLVRVIG